MRCVIDSYIELHYSIEDDIYPVLINTDHIIAVSPSSDKSTSIWCSDGEEFRVIESYETIVEMLQLKLEEG